MAAASQVVVLGAWTLEVHISRLGYSYNSFLLLTSIGVELGGNWFGQARGVCTSGSVGFNLGL